MQKNLISLDIPLAIETPRLLLKMPNTGMGTKLHQAIIDGYENYVQWLNWSE